MLAPPASRAITPERVGLACGAVAAVWCVVQFARFGLEMQFCLDDWEWLGRGTHVTQLLREQLSFRMEVFRPVPQHLYALSHALFGLRTGPLAALLVGAHLVAALGAARVVRAMGFPRLSGAVVALLGLLSPVSVESFEFFSLNQAVLSRALMLLALAALLERDPPRLRAWLPWAALGILSHEQGTLLAPLWLLCRLHRDGVKPTLAAARSRHGLGVLALCFGYLALRFALHSSDPNMPHALGLRALPQKWELFVGHLRDFVALHTGHGVHPGLIPLEGFADPRWSTLHEGLLVAWIAVLGAWSALRPAKAARTALTAALWTLGCYVPYFLAVNESGGYHFNLSLLGVALLPGAALGELWTLCEGRARPLRAALLALGLATVLPFGRSYLRRPPFDATRDIVALLRPRLRAERDGVSHLIFLDASSRRGYEGAPSYIAEMSGEFDFNRPTRPNGAVNWALMLNFPRRSIRVWVLTPAHAPYLCPREGDLALRVRAPDPRSPEVHFTPVERCTREGGLPRGFDPATPEGAALAASPTWSASGAPQRARRYWAAYAARDRAGQIEAGGALLALGQRFDADPALRPRAALALDAVRATMPRPDLAPGVAPGGDWQRVETTRGLARMRSSRGQSASIEVEVASTQAAIDAATEHPRPIAPGRGLVLAFSHVETHVFATGLTQVPLDIVYVHPNGREILATVRRAEPGRVMAPPTRAPSSLVILLPAGFLEAHGLAAGDSIAVELERGEP